MASSNVVRVYLDIETYRKGKGKPFIDDKIIAIGMLEDWEWGLEDWERTEEPELNMFTEWGEGSEEALVRGFYDCLDWLARPANGTCRVEIVGYNILRFDVPHLVQAGVKHGIGTLEELNAFWKEFRIIDFIQQLLLANEGRFEGLALDHVRKVIAASLRPKDLPDLRGKGEVWRWYEERRYSEIEDYLRQDLEFTRYLDLSDMISKLVELTWIRGVPLRDIESEE